MEVIIAGLVGAFVTGALGLIGKKMDWFSPRSKIDVAKVESEIRSDDSENKSRQTQDEINIARVALDITIQLRAQLEKADTMISSLRIEKDSLHKMASELRKESMQRDREQKERIIELENKLQISEQHLNMEKKHCDEISVELTRITKELTALKAKHGLA